MFALKSSVPRTRLLQRSAVTSPSTFTSVAAYSSSQAVFSTAEKKKVVIVGGVAGGATAAARLSRLSNQFDITVIEKSPDVSFANCGLPYYIGREIVDRGKLSLQTPQSLSQQLGVRVFTNTEVTKIHRDGKSVEMKEFMNQGKMSTLNYDYLILSPGASPLRPKLPGIDHPRIMTLRNLQDMDRMDALIAQRDVKTVAVIGAGFIGLEMVEQLRRIGKHVHLVEKAETVLPQADKEMAEFLHAPLIENGVNLHLADGITGFAPSASRPQGVQVKLESGNVIDADMVVLSIGVRPESALAKDANLSTNPRTGHIQVNDFMQTNDPSIYAVGDVIETTDLVFPQFKAAVALGNIANMQARVAADHMVSELKLKDAPKPIAYKGSLGTSIVRAFDNVLALTGWNEKRLQAAKIPYEKTVITAYAHASYYPNALPVTMKLLFDPVSGRVLGGQAVGVDGVDKRIDVIATAITGGLTIEDLSLTQLTYSPPFGSARDVVNVAGLAARNVRDSLVHPSHHLAKDDRDESAKQKEVKVLDVRAKEVASLTPIANSVNIPYKELNDYPDLKKVLDPNVEYKTVCLWGKTAYFSSRILENQGISSSTLIGGMILHEKPHPQPPAADGSTGSSTSGSHGAPAPAVTPVNPNKTEPEATLNVDCTGLSCPGPLLKLKESIATLPPNVTLHVTASDPGFKADVRAFAASNGLILKDVTTTKGIIKASLMKNGPAAPQAASPVQGGHCGQQAGQCQTCGGNGACSNGQCCQGGSGNGAAFPAVRKGATIVVFSEEFDKVLASLVIANGAAAMGGEVTLFFTFWGLNALRDANRHANTPKSAIDSMFGMMMPKGKDNLPLSHMNFGGLGAAMMKHVMNSKHLPNLPDLLASAKAQKIRLVACTMSMEAMGIKPEELIDGVEFGGVAEYLGAAEKSGTNLFI